MQYVYCYLSIWTRVCNIHCTMHIAICCWYLAICIFVNMEQYVFVLILIRPDSQPPTAGRLLIHRTPMLITHNHCNDAPMYQFTNAPMYQCTNVPMYQCTNVARYQNTNVPFAPIYRTPMLIAHNHCNNVPIYQCTNSTMYQYTNVARYENTKVPLALIHRTPMLITHNHCNNAPMYQFTNVPMYQFTNLPKIYGTHWQNNVTQSETAE